MQKISDADLEKALHRIVYRPEGRIKNFRALPLAERSTVFNHLTPGMRQEILSGLSADEVVELLDHLDLRRAHHILDKMKDARRRGRIVARLKNELHSKIECFLQFHPQAKTGLVHLNYVLLEDTKTVAETAEIIEDYLHTTGKIPAVLVSERGKLVGEVSLGALVRASNQSSIGHHVIEIKTLVYNSSRQEIFSLFTSVPHKKVALLDNDGSVLGVVYSDDVMELLGEAPASTLYSFAGVEESERPFDGMWSKVRHRHRWLILNLFTSFMAAGVVALYEGTLSEIVLLAMYMPVIAGMGGNAATQTLAVMVRGIAVGEITLRNSRPAIVREVGAGLVNGVITGAIVAVVATVFNQDPLLGLVVGLSVIAGLVVAGFTGTIIPLLLKYFGKDPATSATIFITTATDVLGFVVLLGLASLILV
jgi:magnesium transporter